MRGSRLLRRLPSPPHSTPQARKRVEAANTLDARLDAAEEAQDKREQAEKQIQDNAGLNAGNDDEDALSMFM